MISTLVRDMNPGPGFPERDLGKGLSWRAWDGHGRHRLQGQGAAAQFILRWM